MNAVSRIFLVIVSLSFLCVIFELMRQKKLKEKYAILWLIAGVLMFLIAIFNNILLCISKLLGTIIPSNAIFFLSIIFIILVNFHFSLVISRLSEQNKKIIQQLALMEAELKSRAVDFKKETP